MSYISSVEGAVRSCSISYPLGLKSTSSNVGDIINYKVTDIDRIGNLIVAGTCIDANICPVGMGSAARVIFEYIATGTLGFSWTLYLKKNSGTDYEVSDVMSLKASPIDNFFVAAIKHLSNNRVVFMRIASSTTTPTAITNIVALDSSDNHLIEPDGMHNDGVNNFSHT